MRSNLKSRSVIIALTIGVLLLAAAALASTLVIGSPPAAPHAAATGKSPQLYITPSAGTLKPGSTLTAEVRESSGDTSVNAVQANFTYPQDKLQYQSVSDSGSAFAVSAETKGGSSMVKIARGTTSPVTGDQLVATVYFTVKSGSGTADLDFTSDSALMTSVTNSNMLTASGSASYKIGK